MNKGRFFLTRFWMLIFCLPGAAFSQGEGVIAKSAIAHPADGNTKHMYTLEWAYIPAGTRMVALDSVLEFSGKSRRLMLTEHGMFVYLDVSKYWDSEAVKYFQRQKERVFIKRRFKAEVKVGKKKTIMLTLTRGEVYPLLEEDEAFFVIDVSRNENLPNRFKKLPLRAQIPRTSANAVDYDDIISSEKVHHIHLFAFGGIIGLEKLKGQERAVPMRVQAPRRATLGGFFKELGIGVSERDELAAYGKDVHAQRKYFKRRGGSGVYRITVLKSRAEGKASHAFDISTPENLRVMINRDWALDRSLEIYRDGRVLLSSPEQYFRFNEELLDSGFAEEDAPFIIWKTAKWKDFKTPALRLPGLGL